MISVGPSVRAVAPFRVALLLGLLLSGAGLVAAVALSRSVLAPLASACLRACSSDHLPIFVALGCAGLLVAAVGSGLLGGLAVLGRQLAVTGRLVRQVESLSARPPARVAGLASRLGIDRRLTYVRDPAAYAFCYGFLSPRICISSGMARRLSNRELQAVLLHEAFHMRRRDPLKVLLARLVAGALFLLPAARDLRDRYLLERELVADDHVVGQMSARPLAGALLKTCRGAGRRPIHAAAAVGAFDAVGHRIRHLARPSERPGPLPARRVVASLAVVALLLAATAGSSVAAERSLASAGGCCTSGAVCDLPAAHGRAVR